MPHVLERAATGRSKCRACGQAIAKDAWRLGEAIPNLYADGDGAESRQWYHPRCAAYRRPEAFLAAVRAASDPLEERERWIEAAELGVAFPRLPRLDRAERATSGRAACRACRAPIEKQSWRLGLLFWQDGRFSPSGFLHPGCVATYLGTPNVMDRVRYFTPDLSDGDASDVAQAIARGPLPAADAPAPSD